MNWSMMTGDGSAHGNRAAPGLTVERPLNCRLCTVTNADPRTETPPQAAMTVGQYGNAGTWMIVRGILGVAFGLATAFWPREMVGGPTNLFIGVHTAGYIVGAFLILQAIALLLQARVTPTGPRTPLIGQAIVVIPALIFLLLAGDPGQLRAAVCVWAFLHGVLELWLYAQVKSLPNAQDYLIAGGLHVLLGVVLAAGTTMQALSVAGFAGAAVLISGVFYIIGGFTRRSRFRAIRESGLSAGDPAVGSADQAADVAGTVPNGSADVAADIAEPAANGTADTEADSTDLDDTIVGRPAGTDDSDSPDTASPDNAERTDPGA